MAGSTRERLLAAGLTLFSGKGFLATTTREIAQEAGVAEVTLFRHFPTKETLLEEVMSQFSLIPAFKALLPELYSLPCREGVQRLAQFLFESMVSRKAWIILMQAEVRRNPDKLLTVYHQFLDRVFDLISEFFMFQQQKGEMRQFDTVLAARAFYSLIFSYFNSEEVLLRKQYRPTDRSVQLGEMISIFSVGLLAA